MFTSENFLNNHVIPAKHLCVFFQHLYGTLFGTNLHYICWKFRIKIKKIVALATPSNGAIWDELSEQHQHQSIKKHYI